jgi:hypothetical protein
MATPAVAVGNSNKLTQVEKQEQEIAEACNRLIKNCIICWNYLKKKMRKKWGQVLKYQF